MEENETAGREQGLKSQEPYMNPGQARMEKGELEKLK
jgi:hypothetical protein